MNGQCLRMIDCYLHMSVFFCKLRIQHLTSSSYQDPMSLFFPCTFTSTQCDRQDVAPHFLAYPSSNPVFNLDVPKLVVRNTFIEFEEDILPNTFGATKRSKSCTHCKLNV